ncbi:hypothetical protein OVA26_16685 [Microbacterium sp. SL62]|uniref:hypothetical protein n=1 Tax=Microbacterium sp. SL62 TaxID=2995139 RepID=UPI0022726C55|nr:hypothetical protein [Microbacterium sp. SL62]MCY1718575.1 hypothetical protein [Microbacterium sp. SL62]
MTSPGAQPGLTGTPDQWWENAEPITEEEVADRVLGTWYITAETRNREHTGAFRIALPTAAGNHQRRDQLQRRAYENGFRPTDISPNVRALMRIAVAREPWMDAAFVFATDPDTNERVLWRPKNGRWVLVSNASRSCSEAAMADLRPVIAVITEQEEGVSE